MSPLLWSAWSAGISLRFARSPDAPTMTIAQLQIPILIDPYSLFLWIQSRCLVEFQTPKCLYECVR